ncbi:DUF342 domain-containing protein [candidate division KSB1 bacterium]
MSDNVESKDGSVSVEILNDELEAAILVTPAQGEGKAPTLNMARDALRKARVTIGIDKAMLDDIFKNELFNENVTVAKGIPPVDGKDSHIEYFFETNQVAQPSEDEKGNVDYKEINLLQNVRKDQKLAELHPPVPGKEGKTVTGKQLLPKVGIVRKLPAGINTEISKNNPNILVASAEGNAYLKAGSLITVDSIYVVNSHVDFNTGNIDYVGALIIKGDVKAGFTVKSQSDLEIQGLVEDAFIKSGANIMIKNGFLGKGCGTIEAEGNVFLKFCENQTIQAKGDIQVGEFVLHSTLKSGSKIEVTGKKGVIVGGKTIAKNGLSVREIGNYQDARTEVIVGIDDELMKKIEEIENEFVKINENHANIKKAIYTLIKKKMELNELPKDQANLLGKLQLLQSALPAQRQQLEEQKKKTEEELKKYENVKIVVESKIYPGVRLQMLNYKKVITEEMGKTTFKIIDKGIKGVSE